MFSLLHQYLINCDDVALPGIGTLQLTSSSAEMIANGQISPPKQTVVLKNEANAGDDQKLIHFLCKQLDLSETQASTVFHHFLTLTKEKLDEHGLVVWENLGSLKKDNNNNLYFEQSNVITDYLLPVETTRIHNSNTMKYDVLVGENETDSIAIQEGLAEKKGTKIAWWVWAIIIAVAALVVIAFRFAG